MQIDLLLSKRQRFPTLAELDDAHAETGVEVDRAVDVMASDDEVIERFDRQ